MNEETEEVRVLTSITYKMTWSGEFGIGVIFGVVLRTFQTIIEQLEKEPKKLYFEDISMIEDLRLSEANLALERSSSHVVGNECRLIQV